MHHFFVSPQSVGEEKIVITGSDVNHIKNALRMKPGELIQISDGLGSDYLCRIEHMENSQVEAAIVEKQAAESFLCGSIYFRGFPNRTRWN